MNPRPQTLDWAQRLIALDTTSRNSNLPLIALVEEELTRLGVTFHRCPDPTGTKANLIATIPAADGSRDGGVVLSGHTDVVPVDGQRWTSDPFTPVVRDGRLYGRGACDMKGFLAVVLAALPDLVAATLSEPVHLAFSYDEELGCIGGDQIVKDFAGLGLSPRVALIGEPTSMRVIAAHKSVNLALIEVTGLAVHSSLKPRGVNAIEHAARIVTAISELGDEYARSGARDEAYDVPHTTIGINLIQGGIASNTVADHCALEADFRTIAADDPLVVLDQIRAIASAEDERMRSAYPGRDVGVRVTTKSLVPGLESSLDGLAAQLAEALGGVAGGDKVAYGTEAGQFSGAGMDAVVVGPGSIEQAHGPDEYVELSQLALCDEMLAALVAHLSR